MRNDVLTPFSKTLSDPAFKGLDNASFEVAASDVSVSEPAGPKTP